MFQRFIRHDHAYVTCCTVVSPKWLSDSLPTTSMAYRHIRREAAEATRLNQSGAPLGQVPFRCRLLTTIAKLSAAKPIVATTPLPTGGNRTAAIVTVAGRGFRIGPAAARLNPTCAPLSHVSETGMVTALAGCGIKNVVTIRATSVII